MSQVCKKWSTPPTSPTSVAISDLGADRFPVLLLNHKKLPESILEGTVPTASEGEGEASLPTSWVSRMLSGWC